MDAFRITTFLLRKLRRHREIVTASPEPQIISFDEGDWKPISKYAFLVSSSGKGYEITVREVELAS
jgi:hypothetical protein